jgi:hypothetical protein
MLEKITTILLATSLLIAVSILYAVPIVLLWNSCLVGTIDGVHEINFWKALGLTILLNLLTPLSKSKD